MTVHATATKTQLGVFFAYDKPQEVEKLTLQPQKPIIGKTFQKAASVVMNYLETVAFEQSSLEEFKKKMETDQ